MAIIQLTQPMTEQQERETQNSNNNFLNSDKISKSEKGTEIPTMEQVISTIHHAFANIGKSANYTFVFYADLLAIRYSGGLWEINFEGKINTNTSTNPSDTAYGFDKSVICSATTMPVNAVFSGCHLQFITAAGAVPQASNDFGGTLATSGDYLLPGRYYTGIGDFGAWGSGDTALVAGNMIRGKMYFQEVTT